MDFNNGHFCRGGSRPDLWDPFYVSVLVWSGRDLGWAFYVLCSMFSISLVFGRYGSQAGTAIYRCLWLGTILRYPFLTCVCGRLSLFSLVTLQNCSFVSLLFLFKVFWVNKKSWTRATLRFGPLLILHPTSVTKVLNYGKGDPVTLMWRGCGRSPPIGHRENI